VEYRQEYVDLRDTDIKYLPGKEPPNPKSPERAYAAMSQIVLHRLGLLFREGWTLDGPFDAAVSTETKVPSMIYLNFDPRVRGPHQKYIGATVRLRRLG